MTFHIFKIMLIPKRIIWIFIFIHLHVIIFILFPFISLLLLIVKTASQVAQQQRTHRLSRRCRRHRFDPWVGKIPWRRRWQLTAEFLPGNSHGQGHLAGYSPWDHRVRREPARRVAAAAHDRRILQTMWKYFPDVNCSQSFFLGKLIFFYVSGSPKQAHY